jgi:hypothetical protein
MVEHADMSQSTSATSDLALISAFLVDLESKSTSHHFPNPLLEM